jgi:hypothetical protein
MSVDEAWTSHQRRVQELEHAGKVVTSSPRLDRYVEWSHQEEQAIG